MAEAARQLEQRQRIAVRLGDDPISHNGVKAARDNRGEEVATNIAADRVELTRDEAFEYVKMEYEGAHKKDTLPAVPAMGKLPADLPARLAGGQYRATYYYNVGLQKELFNSNFGFRASFRETFYLAPDFGQNYLTILKHATTLQPMAGFYLRF